MLIVTLFAFRTFCALRPLMIVEPFFSVSVAAAIEAELTAEPAASLIVAVNVAVDPGMYRAIVAMVLFYHIRDHDPCGGQAASC